MDGTSVFTCVGVSWCILLLPYFLQKINFR
jgi:hypothetical protein